MVCSFRRPLYLHRMVRFPIDLLLKLRFVHSIVPSLFGRSLLSTVTRPPPVSILGETCSYILTTLGCNLLSAATFFTQSLSVPLGTPVTVSTVSWDIPLR